MMNYVFHPIGHGKRRGGGYKPKTKLVKAQLWPLLSLHPRLQCIKPCLMWCTLAVLCTLCWVRLKSLLMLLLYVIRVGSDFQEWWFSKIILCDIKCNYLAVVLRQFYLHQNKCFHLYISARILSHLWLR